MIQSISIGKEYSVFLFGFFTVNNVYQYQLKNGQAIHQKVEDNNIRFNNKMNNKRHRNFISNYEDQREYTKEFLENLYAN